MRKRLRSRNADIDGIDACLLAALADDARTSIAGLARTVGLSSPSVSERIRRLEESGVIKRYTIDIDPVAIGRPISVWLRISPIPGQLHKVVEIIQGLPEIVECDRVTGDDCFFARAHVRDVGELEQVIDNLISHASTNTAVIQSPPVNRRLPPLVDDRNPDKKRGAA